jgi:uncharacterized coiled-coil DUF342 family protein
LQDEYKHVNELAQKAAALQKVLAAAKDEIRNMMDKKGGLLDKAAKMKAEMEAVVSQRDSVNKQIQELKEKISSLMKAKSEARTEIEEKKKELREAKSKLEGSEEYLNRKLRELEWRLVTTGVSVEEESAIVSSIAELHRRLAPHEKTKRISEELGAMRERTSKLNDELVKLLEEKRRLVEESQRYHESFLQIKESRMKILEEVENLREKAAKLKAEMDKRFMDLVSINAEITLHESRMRKSMEDERNEKQRLERATKAQVAQTTAEKLRRGESVSLEEFRIYMEGSSEV